MHLNTLKPARGARRDAKRVGRGASAGGGKTGGRGHKGQKSRSGGGPRVGFEGGQMPLQRRLPKFGFNSHKARFADEVTVAVLGRVEGERVDLDTLRAARLIGARVRRVKVVLKGEPARAFKLRGVAVSRGARAAIEAAGGSIED